MRYESLIFDIDGTIWDSRALVAEGYNLQLQREGFPQAQVDVDSLKPLFGRVLPEIADILFGFLPKEERLPLILRCAETQDQYLKDNPCQVGYPQVAETLEALSKTHRLFIVSNSQQGYPQLCMEKLGIAPYFAGALCFGDTGTSKGQTIRTLMERYHIESAAYIGDTQGDYEATQEAGLPFIWASYGFGTPQSYDEKIDSFSDLLKL